MTFYKCSRSLLRSVFAALWLLLCIGGAQAAETITYFHNDISGTPLVATDTSGNVVWKENYRPYGDRLQKQAASTNNSLWFTGKSADVSTGLSYFGARYYDPVLGRFMGVDAAAFQENNIHSFNRYAYANNNPYRYVDPDGNIPIDTLWDIANVAYDLGKAGFGAAIGNPAMVAEGLADAALDTAAAAVPYLPAGSSKLARMAAESADGAKRETGSYTNTHASGRTYDGKGSRERSQASGRRVEQEAGDQHVATEWRPAPTQRDAFKDESRRLDSHGGPSAPGNHNKIESPGKKYRAKDGS